MIVTEVREVVGIVLPHNFCYKYFCYKFSLLCLVNFVVPCTSCLRNWDIDVIRRKIRMLIFSIEIGRHCKWLIHTSEEDWLAGSRRRLVDVRLIEE